LYGNWHIADGKLYCEYSDDSSSSWVIEVRYVDGTTYLYYYSSDAPAFWLYSDDPDIPNLPEPSPETLYTTDSDVTDYLVNVEWNVVHYEYPDGRIEGMEPFTTIYYADGTFVETFEMESFYGTWYIEDGYILKSYLDAEAYMFSIFIKQIAESGTFYLYLGVLDEGEEHYYEGGFEIYTTYQP